MSEVVTTLAGYVAVDPKLFVSANGTAFTTFRMASTRRFFDRSTGQWSDGQTLWFTVKTWRDTARNVAESLRKGDAIVATGVVGMDEWDGPDGPRTSFVLEARNLGPDLSRGVARFVPVVHRAAAGQGTEPARHPGGAQVPGEEVSGEQLSGAVEIEDPWAQDVAGLAGLAGLAGDEDDEPGAGSARSDDEAPGDGAGDRSTSRAGREPVGATA